MCIRRTKFAFVFITAALLLEPNRVGDAAYAQAGLVKVTPLGSHSGELCARDRAFLFEDRPASASCTTLASWSTRWIRGWVMST